MCGRFVLKTLDVLFDEFLVDPIPLVAHYNIAPTQTVPIIRTVASSDRREVAPAHWGLIPPWAKDPAVGNRMINARAESVVEKPVFRAPLLKRRCLIPADGFYEWKKLASAGKGKAAKQPYYIHRKDNRLLAFAGLWERWRDEAGHAVDSCTIITTRPNELMRDIHDRMPAIILPESYATWLDPKRTDPGDLLPLLDPIPAKDLDAHAVGPKVNRPQNDNPDCLLPASTEGGDATLFG